MLVVIKVLGVYCLRLPIHAMIEGGELNDMLGVIKVLGVKAALQQTLFYCLRLPIHPLLEGGDPNATLGVMKVSEANAALQQTLFIVSSSPSIYC